MNDLISRQAAIDALKQQAETMSEWSNRYAEQRKGVLTAVNIIEDLSSAHPEPYWIPVTERLPEEYCECLVTYRTVDTQEFMDILEYEPSYEFDYEKGRFKGEWLFATDDERFTDGEVIAWMPLPESFKGVTE